MRTLRDVALVLMVLLAGNTLRAQEVHAAPGKFDYYLLTLSWAPDFCHNVEVLPASERSPVSRGNNSQECSTPRGFVLHGMWPQNFNGTWPANCSSKPGPKDYSQYLDITPSLTLLKHEWTKHGTCSNLQPDVFFQTARKAFNAVKVPPTLQHVDHTLTLKPDDILGQFYQSNPGFVKGSVLLSCGRNDLTAVEVCLDRQTQKAIACRNMKSCGANTIKVAPETASTAGPHQH